MRCFKNVLRTGSSLSIILFAAIHIASAIGIGSPQNVHDPTNIIRDGDTYWIFCTGQGIFRYSSTNLTSWTYSSRQVFTSEPEWCKPYTGNDNDMWAPAVIYMDSAYHIYYSVSSFGTSVSAIGLVTTKSLNNPDFQDQGLVVSSNGSITDINAIDPAIFKDDDGKVWMTYGSWFGGIGQVELDSTTGKTAGTVSKIYGGGHQSLEAPYIFKDGDYYYLVTNRGLCCQGKESTYYITVGRATSVQGPYSGPDPANPDNFLTILSTDANYIGPGHFGLFREGCMNYVSIHYYPGTSPSGWPAKLDILKMTMYNDWPQLTRLYEINDCVSGIEETQNNIPEPVKVYSNPSVNGSFSLEISPSLNNRQLIISVYTLDGKLVLTKEHPYSSIIDMNADLKSGMYFINIQAGEESITKKLMVR